MSLKINVFHKGGILLFDINSVGFKILKFWLVVRRNVLFSQGNSCGGKEKKWGNNVHNVCYEYLLLFSEMDALNLFFILQSSYCKESLQNTTEK